MKYRYLLAAVLFLILFSGCQGKKGAAVKIRIAEQYGLAYAPLQIMKEKKILEKLVPGAEVRWVLLGNTAAIREAVLAGDLDIGFMGIPPFLIARDKGMEWKIATGLSRSPLGLVVPRGKVASLGDFPAGGKIALPQPGSIQHILLSMALEKETGDPSKLDGNLISMKHPDGVNALLSGAVDGHFTAPPYLFLEEEADGFVSILTGEEAMGGPFTFIAGVATEKFHDENPGLYGKFIEAVEQSIAFIQENREETLSILAGSYNMDLDVLEDYLYGRNMVYTTSVEGLEKFIGFMHRTGYLQKEMSGESAVF